MSILQNIPEQRKRVFNPSPLNESIIILMPNPDKGRARKKYYGQISLMNINTKVQHKGQQAESRDI